MDKTLKKSKELLDNVEKNYKKEKGEDVRLQMLSCFFGSQGITKAQVRKIVPLCNNDSEENDNDDESDGNNSDKGDLGNDDSGEVVDNPQEKFVPKASLGLRLMQKWNKQTQKLIHDFSISAWMVPPMPEIREDVRENHTGEHRDAIEQLIDRLFGHEVDYDEDEMREMKDTFWTEFDQFHGKEGIF
jgi:hypothetical protein